MPILSDEAYLTVNRWFARDTWPWRLCRIGWLYYVGENELMQSDLNVASVSAGPLVSLLSARMMEKYSTEAAATLAKSGLKGLKLRNLCDDCQALLIEGTLPAHILERAAPVLCDLDDDDVAALGRVLCGKRADTFVAAVRALRERRDMPLKTALPYVLAAAWDAGLEDWMNDKLQAVKVRSTIAANDIQTDIKTEIKTDFKTDFLKDLKKDKQADVKTPAPIDVHIDISAEPWTKSQTKKK